MQPWGGYKPLRLFAYIMNMATLAEHCCASIRRTTFVPTTFAS